MKKKVFIKLGAVVMALALVVTCFSITGFTVDNAKIQVKAVSVGTCATDKTISVPVSISGNTGFVSARFKVGYDSTHFVLNSVTVGSDYSSLILASQAISEESPAANPYTVSLEGDELPANITANGTFITLNFTVKAETPAGDYDITISECDFVNYDLDAVTFDVTNNKVYTYKGDVNGDGKINSTDALQISRYFNGLQNAINTPAKLAAADVNNDGKVNSTDALQVSRYFNGLASVIK